MLNRQDRWFLGVFTAIILVVGGIFFYTLSVTRTPPLDIPPSLEIPKTVDDMKLPPENYVPDTCCKG